MLNKSGLNVMVNIVLVYTIKHTGLNINQSKDKQDRRSIVVSIRCSVGATPVQTALEP